jgi:tRNA threonylcarbamoyladenosine biosynthesis protein TsaB
MNILAVDTAGKSAGVAILSDGRLLYECYMDVGFTHSETLLPMIDAALKATHLACGDIGLFGVNAGPGSFTGLRIGLAAVKGLAFPKNVPCAGVSTLEALAATHTGEGTVICALDARRAQVYWAAFDLATHKRLAPDTAAPADSLAPFLENCKKPAFFVGDGAALCYNKFGQMPGILAAPAALCGGRAAGVALTAQKMYEAGLAQKPAELLPSYHRLSQAERELAERNAAAKHSET